MHRLILLTAFLCLAASTALAQDPAKVDPKHYKVEFENAQVRVLRVHYGPHEKSVMHSHRNTVVILLSDAHRKSTTPDRKSVERTGRAGDTMWTTLETHSSENLSDQPLDGILVEVKSKPGVAKLPARPATD